MLRIFSCLLVLSSVSAWADDSPRPVRVETVRFVSEQDSVTYPGTVQARVQASLGFRVAGKVTDRRVDIGDRVAPGQVLAHLDPVDSQFSLEAADQSVRAAEADAGNARVEFVRYQRLGRNSPAWLPSEFDKRQATLDGANARLAQAQRQLSLARDQLNYTSLEADAAGIITDLKLEIGQVVSAGQTVFTLAHVAETEIVVDVPENRLPDVRAASDIHIRLWSQPDLALTGKVREIGALADPVSRTFAVKVTVIDPPAEMLGLGMTASVRFGRGGGRLVAHLPASAVVSVNGAPSVWVLNPATHHAAARAVTVKGWVGDGSVVIEGGVEPGEQVVSAGASQLDASIPVVAWVGAIR